MLHLAKKYGAATVDDACAAALELGIYQYRFVRRYLERRPPMPRQERHSKMAGKRTSPKLKLDNVFGQRRKQAKMFRAGL
jgi:hypothetical protein